MMPSLLFHSFIMRRTPQSSILSFTKFLLPSTAGGFRQCAKLDENIK